MKKPEQSQKDSSEATDFKTLSLSEMEERLKAEAEEEQLNEDSETSTKDSPKKDEQPVVDDKTKEAQVDEKENASKAESDDSTKKEQSFDYEKAYKELQAEFTRRNQKSKDTEEENATLRERIARLEGLVQGKDEKSPKKSVIDTLKDKSPDAAELFSAFKAELMQEVKESMNQEIHPLRSDIEQRKVNTNGQRFQESIKQFMESDLKELEPEVTTYINDNWEDVKNLIASNENAFEIIKRDVISANLDKVVEIKSRDIIKSEKTKKKEKEVSQSATNKSNVTADSSDFGGKDFKKMSWQEMEKYLPRHQE